jgi:hypothetical protein
VVVRSMWRVRTRTFGHFLYSRRRVPQTPWKQLQTMLVCALSIGICADGVETSAPWAATNTLSTCSDSFRATPCEPEGNYEPP